MLCRNVAQVVLVGVPPRSRQNGLQHICGQRVLCTVLVFFTNCGMSFARDLYAQAAVMRLSRHLTSTAV
eukprot:6168405-Prorocentrum_lima.AAC.1